MSPIVAGPGKKSKAADRGSAALLEPCFIPRTVPPPAPYGALPSQGQLQWHEMEMYNMIEFNQINYLDKDWGWGDESPEIVNPVNFNAEEIVLRAKKAGSKGFLINAKHHGGFCMWPSRTTDYNISRSPWRNGKGDWVGEWEAACRKHGLKFGVYLSPWDRNTAKFGTPEYLDMFKAQLRELLTQYGDLFIIWFDGAPGEGGDGYYGGANEVRNIDASTYYDVPNLSDAIHKMQPNCVMWGVGDEARWIGNEAGWAGVTNWSPEYKPARGPNENGNENGWRWFPGESDAKGTNMGWFWHQGESPRSLNELFKFYLETVGRNATLILNFPPDKTGELPQATVTRMKELGNLLKERLGNDLASNAKIEASETRKAGAQRKYVASNLNDNNKDTYWATDDDVIESSITLTWDKPQNVHYVALMEYIKKGQRIKSFTVETSEDGTNWTPRATDQCTTVGYKRIIPLNGSTTDYGNGYNVKAIRITINDSKACPLLHTVSVF